MLSSYLLQRQGSHLKPLSELKLDDRAMVRRPGHDHVPSALEPCRDDPRSLLRAVVHTTRRDAPRVAGSRPVIMNLNIGFRALPTARQSGNGAAGWPAGVPGRSFHVRLSLSWPLGP